MPLRRTKTKLRIKRRKQPVILRRSIFIALITIICVFTTNLILSSIRHPSQAIVVPAPVTAASQEGSDKQYNLSDSFSVHEGITQQLEASKNALTQVVDFAVPEQMEGKVIHDIQITNGEKVIALTFDDGPWRKTTTQVLDILKENKIKATFFWVGKPLQLYPEVARQVIAEGHAIGNHTWSHQYRKFDQVEAAKEIDDTAALIYKTTGVKTALFRPPGGVLKNGLASYAQKNKYAIMMWSVDCGDSHGHHVAAPTLISNVMKAVKPGGIILLHDGGGNRSTTVEALPKIIDGLRKEGYKFVTLPELLQMQSQKTSSHAADAGQVQPGEHKPLTE